MRENKGGGILGTSLVFKRRVFGNRCNQLLREPDELCIVSTSSGGLPASLPITGTDDETRRPLLPEEVGTRL